MPRLRRYLPPLLMLLPVIFICGKLLLTPVTMDDEPGVNATGRGWPWEFSIAGEQYDQQSSAPWLVSTEISEFSWRLLFVDIVVLLAVVAGAWFALMWCWRRAGYRFRFSLRTCLLVVLVLALPLGWWMGQVKSQRDEQRLMQELQDLAQFNSSRYVGPGWLERLWPRDELTIFVRVDSISVNHDLDEHQAAALLSAIENLPGLNALDCKSCVVLHAGADDECQRPLITPSSVPDPAILGHLEKISFALDNAAATPDTLQVLGKLPRLKDLSLLDCPGIGAGLKYLKQCQTLECLNLSGTKATDEDVGQLVGLTNLRMLDLSGTAITDDAIDSIVKLRSLTEIRLRNLRSLAGRNLLRLLELPHLTSLDIGNTFDGSDQIYDTLTKLYAALAERRNKLAPSPPEPN